jgi:hypothetical protein
MRVSSSHHGECGHCATNRSVRTAKVLVCRGEQGFAYMNAQRGVYGGQYGNPLLTPAHRPLTRTFISEAPVPTNHGE